MDGYSWSSRKQQGALLCQCGPPAKTSSGQRPLFGSDSRSRGLVLSRQVLVIGKAYVEPICNVHVENVLLQRDYIID